MKYPLPLAEIQPFPDVDRGSVLWTVPHRGRLVVSDTGCDAESGEETTCDCLSFGSDRESHKLPFRFLVPASLRAAQV